MTDDADNMVNTTVPMTYTRDNACRGRRFPVDMDAEGNLLYVTDGESMAPLMNTMQGTA